MLPLRFCWIWSRFSSMVLVFLFFFEVVNSGTERWCVRNVDRAKKKFDSFIFFFLRNSFAERFHRVWRGRRKKSGRSHQSGRGRGHDWPRGGATNGATNQKKGHDFFRFFPTGPFVLSSSFLLGPLPFDKGPTALGAPQSSVGGRRRRISLSLSLTPSPPTPSDHVTCFLRVRVVVFFGTSDAVERTVRQPRPYRRRRQQREQRRDVFFSKKNLLDRPSMGVLQGDSPTPGPAMYWVSPPLWCHPFWVVAKKNWTTHEFWNFCGATVEHRRIVPTFDATLEKRLLSLAWGEGNHWNRPSAERLEQSALGRGNRVWTMWRWNRTDFFFFWCPLISFVFFFDVCGWAGVSVLRMPVQQTRRLSTQ